VTPARRTRRLWSSMMNKTYSRWRNTVSTVKLVARPYAGRLAAQERPPGRRGMSSAGSMPWARNLPDRGHDHLGLGPGRPLTRHAARRSAARRAPSPPSTQASR
jgi:hypothetical protein